MAFIMLSAGLSLGSFALDENNNTGNPPLQFHLNNKFKIIQIADAQDVAETSPDLIKFLNRVIKDENPDLVVFTGDQLAGYDFKFGDVEGVKKTIDNILKPVVDNGRAFAVVFGNHDGEALSKEEQMAIYMSYPKCYAVDEGDAVSGVGTYNIPIYSREGDKVLFNLYLFDSGSYDEENGGYDHVKKDQIDWYVKKSNELKENNNGEAVPSIAFQHIPVQEMYYTLSVAQVKTKASIKGYGAFSSYYFELNSENFSSANSSPNYFKEPISASTDNKGQAEAWISQGDVIAAFFGHDHTNSFVCSLNDGIDLGYCPGAGFYSYGDGYERAVRVFELNAENPSSYSTRLVTYKSYFGEEVSDKTHFFVTQYLTPKNTYDGIMMGLKALSLLIFIVSAIVLIIKRPFSKRFKRKKEYAKQNGLPEPTLFGEIKALFEKIKEKSQANWQTEDDSDNPGTAAKNQNQNQKNIHHAKNNKKKKKKKKKK